MKRSVRDALAQKEALPQIRSEEIKRKQYDTTPEKPPQVKEKVPFASDSEQVDIKNILTTLRNKRNDEAETAPVSGETETDKNSTNDTGMPVMRIQVDRPPQTPFDINGLQVIGTVFDTYILASDSDTFYLIDQHAAHERIFFEKLLNQYNTGEKNSQQLLVPLNLGVPADVTATEDEWMGQLVNMGYYLEFFGNNTYRIREIPAFMDMSEAEGFLRDFFTEAEGRPDFTDERAVSRIITRSCKSAVKGGDILDRREIDALMKDLAACINPFSCPHGRPTFVRMTRYEIEKMFKRV